MQKVAVQSWREKTRTQILLTKTLDGNMPIIILIKMMPMYVYTHVHVYKHVDLPGSCFHYIAMRIFTFEGTEQVSLLQGPMEILPLTSSTFPLVTQWILGVYLQSCGWGSAGRSSHIGRAASSRNNVSTKAVLMEPLEGCSFLLTWERVKFKDIRNIDVYMPVRISSSRLARLMVRPYLIKVQCYREMDGRMDR